MAIQMMMQKMCCPCCMHCRVFFCSAIRLHDQMMQPGPVADRVKGLLAVSW